MSYDLAVTSGGISGICTTINKAALLFGLVVQRADLDVGTAHPRSSDYEFLSNIGNCGWSIGAFAGYLDSRQRIASLGAATKTDGVVAGVHGRYAGGNIRFGASVLYDGGDARTSRKLPGAGDTIGRYGLHSWASDVSVGYALAMADD